MVIFVILIGLAASDCAFYQAGGVPKGYEKPVPPTAQHFSQPACPMFPSGSELCCNPLQNINMFIKYNVLDDTFGNAVGGCDICAANMKKMWCYFTCSPMQSSFVSAGKQEMTRDPATRQMIEVLRLNFTVTNNLACQLYQSCKKCPYVTQVSAMQSPKGFLEFQGFHGMTIGRTWTTFYFSDNPADSPLDLNFTSCDKDITELYGYKIKPCTCNNCEFVCKPLYISGSSTLHGLDWTLIGIAYLVLVIFSGILFIGRFFWDKRKRRDQEDLLPEREMSYEEA